MQPMKGLPQANKWRRQSITKYTNHLHGYCYACNDFGHKTHISLNLEVFYYKAFNKIHSFSFEVSSCFCLLHCKSCSCWLLLLYESFELLHYPLQLLQNDIIVIFYLGLIGFSFISYPDRKSVV